MPNVKVFIEKENLTKMIKADSIEDVLRKLGINPEVVLVAKNNILVTKKAKIKEGDEIKLLSIVSGG